MEEEIKQDVNQEVTKETVVTQKETVVVEKPKKKVNGCLIAFLIFLFFTGLIAGGLYWGYKKVIKAMEPKDLNVTYSVQDYEDLMDNIGLEADPSSLCIDCPTPVFSDPHEVSLTVSSAQASAAFEYVNQYLTFAQISGTQIKMNDGNAELTTTLTFQGRTFPVYLSGAISKGTGNTILGEVYDVKAGNLSLPSNITTLVQNGLLGIANEKIASAGDTIRIDVLEITKEGLNFEGLVPTKAE